MASLSGAVSAKRKRTSATEQPTKKRRASSAEEEDPNAKILLMEQGILESRKNYNDIAVLLAQAQDFKSGKPEAMLSTIALCRIFVRLLAQGSLIAKKSLSEKETVVVGWLKGQFGQFKEVLLALLGDEEVATTALTLCMRTLKAEGQYLYDKAEFTFPRAFIEDIVTGLIAADNDEVRQAFIEEFAEQYDDIRYYTFKSAKYVDPKFQICFICMPELTERFRAAIEGLAASGELPAEVFDRAFSLLSALDGVPESAEELEDFYVSKPEKKSHYLRSVTQHRKQGQEAWLALMQLVNTNDQRKRILSIMSTVIAPWFTKPELLSDFMTSCYDAGGSLSLLALSGVFYLIKERNLDYPSFYPKLYSLLNRDILHSKHRSRFFRLLDTFLASTHLPAALVASF
jgi:U3 small nucleolar RNA-associated protein 19